MNRRIRKKQLRRALLEFVDACDKYEAACERIYHKAVQDFMDAQGKSREISNAALRRYMEVVSLLAHSGPPPRSLTERYGCWSCSKRYAATLNDFYGGVCPGP